MLNTFSRDEAIVRYRHLYGSFHKTVNQLERAREQADMLKGAMSLLREVFGMEEPQFMGQMPLPEAKPADGAAIPPVEPTPDAAKPETPSVEGAPAKTDEEKPAESAKE